MGDIVIIPSNSDWDCLIFPSLNVLPEFSVLIKVIYM